MVKQLTAKRCEKISHMEAPTEFLHQGEKQQNTSTKEGDNSGPHENKEKKYRGVQGKVDPKKLRVIHPCSTKLKEFLQKPLTDESYPPLYRLCGY